MGDKILVSMGDNEHRNKAITVTNDGATILSSIHVDNPAARVLIDISKVQDQEVGDGTTTVTVLAGELLREAEKLVQNKIHPQIIMKGWREARKVAQKVLEEISVDNFQDKEALKNGFPLAARRLSPTPRSWLPTPPLTTTRSRSWDPRSRSTPWTRSARSKKLRSAR